MSIVQIQPALLFDSNIYLVLGSEKTAMIDTGTGFAVDQTIESVKNVLNGRPLDYVFVTHCHYDHVGGLGAIIEEFSPKKVFAGKKDAVPLREGDTEPTLGSRFGGAIRPMDVTNFDEGDKVDLGKHILVAIDTPGHTAGSISIIDEVTRALFSGDTVFVDGVGNTTFPTGSAVMMIKSLKKLEGIEFNGFYPGHGPVVNTGGLEFVKKGLRSMGV